MLRSELFAATSLIGPPVPRWSLGTKGYFKDGAQRRSGAWNPYIVEGDRCSASGDRDYAARDAEWADVNGYLAEPGIVGGIGDWGERGTRIRAK